MVPEKLGYGRATPETIACPAAMLAGVRPALTKGGQGRTHTEEIGELVPARCVDQQLVVAHRREHRCHRGHRDGHDVRFGGVAESQGQRDGLRTEQRGRG